MATMKRRGSRRATPRSRTGRRPASCRACRASSRSSVFLLVRPVVLLRAHCGLCWRGSDGLLASWLVSLSAYRKQSLPASWPPRYPSSPCFHELTSSLCHYRRLNRWRWRRIHGRSTTAIGLLSRGRAGSSICGKAQPAGCLPEPRPAAPAPSVRHPAFGPRAASTRRRALDYSGLVRRSVVVLVLRGLDLDRRRLARQFALLGRLHRDRLSARATCAASAAPAAPATRARAGLVTRLPVCALGA